MLRRTRVILALVLVALFGFAAQAHAADKLYFTKKADVPLRAQPYTNYPTIRPLPKDMPVTIREYFTNPATGSTWGKTYNDTWIFMGNLVAGTRTLSGTGMQLTDRDPVVLHKGPASNAPESRRVGLHAPLNVRVCFYNDRGNEWALLDDGSYVYTEYFGGRHADSICRLSAATYRDNDDRVTHTRTSVPEYVCACGKSMHKGSAIVVSEDHVFGEPTKCACGFTRPALPATGWYEAATAGVIAHTDCYGNAPQKGRALTQSQMVQITQVKYNKYNNVWGYNSSLGWIWMDNLVKHTTAHQTKRTADSSVAKALSFTNHAATTYREEICYCGVAYKRYVVSQAVTQPHSFTGTRCFCGYDKGATLYWPVASGKVSSQMGMRYETRGRKLHTGIDVSSPKWAEVKPVSAGFVIRADSRCNDSNCYTHEYGKDVAVRHLDGRVSHYAHLASVSVKRGDFVLPTDTLGTTGATGATSALHLHFEFRRATGTDVLPVWNGSWTPLNSNPVQTTVIKYDEWDATRTKVVKSTYDGRDVDWQFTGKSGTKWASGPIAAELTNISPDAPTYVYQWPR